VKVDLSCVHAIVYKLPENIAIPVVGSVSWVKDSRRASRTSKKECPGDVTKRASDKRAYT